MNYRKMLDNKKKMNSFFNDVKDFTNKNVSKLSNTGKDVKDNFKKNVGEIKTSVKTSLKERFAREFRKHYFAYAVEYIDNLFLKELMSGATSITVGEDGIITMEDLVKAISQDMLDEELLAYYTERNSIINLFKSLCIYYNAEPQVECEVNNKSFTITLIEEVSTEETTEVEDELEDEFVDEDIAKDFEIKAEETKEELVNACLDTVKDVKEEISE